MEKKNNLTVLMLIIFIILTLMLGGFIIYDKVLKKEDKTSVNNTSTNDNTANSKVNSYNVELRENQVSKEKSCVDEAITYKELYINDKKIDLGFSKDSNACRWIYIKDFQKFNDFIVLDVVNGFVEGNREYYVIDYQGKILKCIDIIDGNKYVKKYYVDGSDIYVEAYAIDNDSCSHGADYVIGGLYMYTYANGYLSEIKKVENKTFADELKLNNTNFADFCK